MPAAAADVSTITLRHWGVTALKAFQLDFTSNGPITLALFHKAHHVRVAQEEPLSRGEVQPLCNSPFANLGNGMESSLRCPELIAQEISKLPIVQCLP